MRHLSCEYCLEPGKGRFLWKCQEGSEHRTVGPVALGPSVLSKLQEAELEGETVFGDLLFTTLLPKGSELREEYGKAMAHARALGLGLRFRLALTDTLAEEVRDLAWEQIRDPVEGGLALSPWIAFTLFLPYDGLRRADAASLSRRPRILVAVADPADLQHHRLPELDGVRVREAMRQALYGSADCDVLEGPVTLASLREALETGRRDVLHLIAHSHERGLVLETERGLAKAVQIGDLVSILGNRSSLRALILMACAQGGHQGLAEQLVRRGIPVALGMRREVGLLSLEVFASAFYHRLAETGEVDVAANAAREALLAKPATRCDWSGVVLWTNLPDGRVWHPASAFAPRSWLRALALSIPFLLNEPAVPRPVSLQTERQSPAVIAAPPQRVSPSASISRQDKPSATRPSRPSPPAAQGAVPAGVRQKIKDARAYLGVGLYEQSRRSYQKAFEELAASAPEISKTLNLSRLRKLEESPLDDEAAREYARLLDPLCPELSTLKQGDFQ